MAKKESAVERESITPTRMRVMISSRSNQPFPYKGKNTSLLADVRKDLLAVIQAETLFDQQLFEAWINEEAPAATQDIWDECIARVRKSDILLVIYSGDAGWAKAGGDVGICHAELQAGVSTARGKVRVLQTDPLAALRKGSDGNRDRLFREYVESQQLFTGAPCKTGEQLIELAKLTLREAVADLARLGVREASKGKFYVGEALDWTRMDIRTRQQRMESTLSTALLDRYKGQRLDKTNALRISVLGSDLLVVCSAIPGPYSLPEARERANQLFLQDWQYGTVLKRNAVGPVHFVACNRNITETQAIRQLGFADATIVAAPFGIYVADDIQKIQLFYLANCRDETTLRYQVQRAFDWLEVAGERALFLDRAASRARIVQAIATENSSRLNRL